MWQKKCYMEQCMAARVLGDYSLVNREILERIKYIRYGN